VIRRPLQPARRAAGTFLALLFALAGSIWAQTPTTGEISGVVTDPSGAMVAAARVSVTNIAGVERQVFTDVGGQYQVPLLPPGTYRVEGEKSGFAKTILNDVIVRITATTNLDIRLPLAQRKEYVEVTSEPPLVQADTPSRGAVIQSNTIQQLPLVTRNFQQLLTLTPGTVSSVPNSSELGRGDSVFSVNGQRTLSNSIVINGVDASSIGTGSTPNLAVPSDDAIEEFIVQTNLYDASQGRNAGSVVAAVTKSGTNAFHGDVYEFLRNNALNANDFFLNRAGIARPPYRRNEFGSTLGGPVVKNRAWFFLSYQGTREVNGTSLTNSIGTVFVPGDLSDDRSTATINALAASYGMPPCPTPGCLDPTALTLLQARLPNGQLVIPSAPHPVAVPSSGPAAPVPVPVTALSRFREDQFNSNLDFQVSPANRLSAKFFWANNPEVQGLFDSFGIGNALPTPGFGAAVNFNQRLLAINDTHILNPALLNDFRFGYSTISTSSVPQEPFTSAQLGIASPLSNLFPGMPEISVSNYFDLGASPFSDNEAAEGTYTVGDTVAWVKGRHTLKVGVEYKHHDVTETFNAYTRGQMFFLGFSGDPFEDFLGGFFDLSGLSIMGSGVNNRDNSSYDWAGFATDDWRVRRNLVLSLGLRYEYFSPYVEAQGRYIGFDPAQLQTATIPGFPPGDNVAITGGFVQAANATHPIPGIPTVQSSLVPPDKNNFAPRIGFAWQPFPAKAHPLVVRGGYGIYYDKPNSRYMNLQELNFPYYTLAQAYTTPISNPFVQVPPPDQFPLAFNNPAIFPYGGPPGFFPAAVAGGVEPVSANGIFPDIHDFRTPYVQQYSLGIQNEFANSWMLDVSYVGSAGTKLLRTMDLNQPTAPSAVATGPLSPGLSSLVVQAFGFHLVQSSSNSNYNSLQASLTKRFSAGLQFLAAYTFSHSIDDYSGDPSGTSDITVVPGNQVVLNNRGNSDFDRRQRLVFSGVYELPKFYRGEFKAVKQIANGWKLSSILTIQTGTPYSVLTDATPFVQARADFNPAQPGCNPNLGGSILSRLNRYFDTSCFVPATANGDFGNTGRNILYGPGQKDLDLALVKVFPLTDTSRLEFRTEFFNTFNNVNFANPINLLSSANVGAIVTTTTGPRAVQFGLKVAF
jgi:Carboxypeptidase regulatory-like domain